MFAQKKYILFIGRKKIHVYSVTTGAKPKEKLVAQLDPEHEPLPNIFLKIKKLVSSPVRILLNDEFAYVTFVTVPTKTANKTLDVKEKAQEQIPEPLDQTSWDFKEMLLVPPTHETPGTEVMQVIALPSVFYKRLKDATTKAFMAVEAMEPLSVSLARLIEHEKDPTLIVYLTKPSLFIVVQKGLVVTADNSDEISPSTVAEFLLTVKKNYLLQIKKIIFAGNTSALDPTAYVNSMLKAEIRSLNPLASLATKKDVKGKGIQTLNLSLTTTPPLSSSPAYEQNEATQDEDTAEDSEEIPHAHPVRKIALTMGLILLIVSIVGGGYGAYQYRSRTVTSAPKSKEKIAPSSTPSTTKPTPTPEANAKDFSVTILNGSGTAGAAGKLAETVEKEGFLVETTGNADNFTFEATEIHYTETVPESIKSLLDKTVKTTYDTLSIKKADTSQETPILIIIGNQQ